MSLPQPLSSLRTRGNNNNFTPYTGARARPKRKAISRRRSQKSIWNNFQFAWGHSVTACRRRRRRGITCKFVGERFSRLKKTRARKCIEPHTRACACGPRITISHFIPERRQRHTRESRERERRKTPRKRAQPSNSMRGRFGSLLSLSLPMIVLTLLSLLVSLSSSADFLPSRARFISIFISCRAALGLSSLLIYLFCLSRSLASERVWLFLALITHAASERRRRKRRRSRAPTVYTNELSVQISILTANLPANRSPTSPPMYSTAADRRGKSTRWLLL